MELEPRGPPLVSLKRTPEQVHAMPRPPLLSRCRKQTVALALALSCSASLAADEQSRIAREMVQVLEAYAVYKMGEYEEAYSRYLALAEAGNRQGMLNVANMQAAGLAVAQSHGQALHWYQRAADSGDAIGMYEVGRAHELGLGTAVDAARAEHWYQRAAEQGNSTAQWLLGKRLYERGEHLPALNWIRAAARQGDEPAAIAFLASLEGRSEGGSQPSADEREAVLATLMAIDRAAQRQDAQALVAALDAQADIQVRLPDSPHWQRLSKAELAALWQASFDYPGDYSYARSATELLAADGRILAFTTLHERIGAGGAAPRELQIEQQAQLRISTGHAVIERLRLDIRDPQR